MTHVPVLAHIPRGARWQVRDAMSYLLADFARATTERASEKALHLVLTFTKCVLAAPLTHRRGIVSPGSSLSAVVKARCEDWIAGAYGALWRNAIKSAKFRSGTRLTKTEQHSHNVKRAIRLAKEGAYSRAAQCLGSSGVHEASPKVIQTLIDKHPQEVPPTDGDFEFPTELPNLPMHKRFDEDDVLKAVKSFPKASAAGGSGFSPTHLLEMLRVPDGRGSQSMISSLTKAVNLLASGTASTAMAPWLCAAPITPLRKRDDGVRPIAVGETLRRLVGKLWMARVKDRAIEHLTASQVGVGVRSGCEALVHATQLAVDQLKDSNRFGVLQLDLANAFNLVSRRAFLRVVRKHFPDMYKWIEYMYGGEEPWLWFGARKWRSATGVQQGDPLGPLLFALALGELLEDFKPKLDAWNKELGGDALVLRSFYCDDGVFVGDHILLQRTLAYFGSEHAKSYGLHLRVDKCQVWWPTAPPLDVRAKYPPGEQGVKQVWTTATRLLQAPIGLEDGARQLVCEDVREAEEVVKKAADLEDAHVAFFLLRKCFGVCKMAYLLRTVPTAATLMGSTEYDGIIESTLRRVLGGYLPHQTFRELQLPIHTRKPSFGVGLSSAASTAPGAYVSARTATHDLVQALILRTGMDTSVIGDESVRKAHEVLQEKAAGQVEPLAMLIENQTRQHQLTRKVESRVLEEIQEHDDERTRWFRTLVGLPGSKDWLGCAPSPGLKTYIRPRDFIVWLKFWCRIPLLQEGQTCPRPGCRAKMDPYGDHLLCCTHSVSTGNNPMQWRHNALVRLLTSELSRARRRPVPEYRDAAAGRSRPDIRCLGTSGGTDYLELSFTHPLSSRCSGRYGRGKAEAVLRVLENRKIKQHSEVVRDPASDTRVVVVGMTSLGGRTREVREYLKDLYRDRAPEEGNSAEWETLAGNHRIAVRLLEGNVHCLTEGVLHASDSADHEDR